MSSPKKPSLRLPPQSLDSEQAVLGSILIRPGGLLDVTDAISTDSFYSERHRLIFDAMLELSLKSQPIDLLTLSTILTEKNLLERVGGNSYLTELIDKVPSASNLKHYADIVEKKYILRELISAGDDVSATGFEESTEPVEEILDRAEKRLFSITGSSKGKKFISIKQTLSGAWERIEKLHGTSGELRGIPTGFADLDSMLAGLQKSDLIILAARPSIGKTTLALDIARMAATTHNIPVGIFSLEMSAQQLVDRMLAAESKVNAWNLRTGKLSTDNEFSRLRDALDKLSKAPIYIDDQAGNSIMHMRATARRLKSEHGLGLIIIDYLQLMTTSKNYDSMVNQVTEISRSLKSLARDLDVPVLALSQLSRAIEARGGKPRLSDLRDSGSIEQDADVVMFIHREDKYKDESERTNIAEILIEKHRNGPTGKVELYFEEKLSTFLPIEKGNMGSFSQQTQRSSDSSNDIF
ncbi:replicative DNA helicase [Candidatus Nomurabacteria bacterium]|jgi:replicative DNA helicase|nr:MAG: replicative DNA helicase [Candidatus Nomurabacteria bacterium]